MKKFSSLSEDLRKLKKKKKTKKTAGIEKKTVGF